MSWNEEKNIPNIRAVDRAGGDLRRGIPVIIRGEDDSCVIALSAETASEGEISEMLRVSTSEPLLALTATRANILRILPSGHPVQLVPLGRRLTAELARSLADPTLDLSGPLKGPFPQVKEAPTTAQTSAVTLAKIARLLPAALIADLPAEKATELAMETGLTMIRAEMILNYPVEAAQSLTEVSVARVPLWASENTRVHAFRPADGGLEHLAIVIGDPPRNEPVLTRLHSECFTGDLMGSMKCDCGEQFRGAMKLMDEQGGGLMLYLAQEGRGIGLINKFRAYALQDEGFDTVDANLRLGFETDERLFQPAAEMMKRLGFDKIRLLTNNPEKVAGLTEHGIDVVERVAHVFPTNPHNAHYLEVKRDKTGHYL